MQNSAANTVVIKLVMVITEMKTINHMYEASHLVYNDLNLLTRKTTGPEKGPHICGCCLVFCQDFA